MKFSLKSFMLGFVCSALAIGTVTYVNASSNSTIKACANKKTGAMRYIAKGKCKKTETSLSWNQTGPQGSPGTPGATGLSGPQGMAGSTGLNGPQGNPGSNGQNFHVIDAVGRDLGPTIGLSGSGRSATIIFEGGLWDVQSYSNIFNGELFIGDFFSDSSCSIPLAVLGETTSPMARGRDRDEVNPKYWKLNGDSFLMSSRVIYGYVRTGSKPDFTYICTASTDSDFYDFGPGIEYEGYDPFLSALTEVTIPAYTAPFTIVAK
jgi:hypothetical protein